MIEQKKRYSREQNERLRQYKIDNNILPKKSGRKPKSNLSNSSTEANPAMNENSTDIQNTVSESITTSNDLPISEVKKITHRGLDLTIYKVLDDEKVDKDLYDITFDGQYCISYKELTKFCNYAVEIEEQHNITCY